MKKKVLLIGARGVGKTTLLRRWQRQSSTQRQWIDLDEAIQKKHNVSLLQFFEKWGEKNFRAEEQMMLTRILSEPEEAVIAVGAGFDWDQFSWPIDRSEIEVIWVSRESDEAGRIFLDRPRLNAGLTQLEEYLLRYTERIKNYRRISDWTHLMPEGDFMSSLEEISILEGTRQGIGGIFTLHQHHQSAVFYEKLRDWQFDYIEVRDDLWDFSQMLPLRNRLRAAGQKILWSVRDGKNEVVRLAASDDIVDWGLEVSGQPAAGCSILSSHGSQPPTGPLHLKWSPIVEDWVGVMEGIQWQGENPAGRSYLPRSKNGRWRWLRLWQKNRQQLNFIRDSTGSVLDQPTVHEWLRAISSPTHFAAVIGDPVSLSWSPMEHLEFFKKREMPFYSVPVRRQELPDAMALLEGLGLRAAAITSPLKEEAFQWARAQTPVSQELLSANTFVLKEGEWLVDSTDIVGLDVVKRENQLGDEPLVWGGGGTMSSMQKIFPKAHFFSVRTGLDRAEVGAKEARRAPPSDFVIWAAGPEAAPPPDTWKPQIVLDLNYFEASRAREYAQARGAKYISGKTMFHAQAKAQQELWTKYIQFPQA